MNKFKFKKHHFLISSLVILLGFSSSVSALTTEQFFNNNNILFYNPYDVLPSQPENTTTATDFDPCVPTATAAVGSHLTLTAAGKSKLDSLASKIKTNSELHKAEYIQAMKTVGAPEKWWPVLSVIDYRERNYNTTKSILNGIDVIDGRAKGSFDDPNFPIGRNYQEDLVQGIKHFMQKDSVVGVDLKQAQNWTFDNVVNTALAYNRGVMYKEAGLSWKDSGYAANGLEVYKHPGRLDSPAVCPIMSGKYGFNCNITNHDLGFAPLVNFILNNYSTAQPSTQNQTNDLPEECKNNGQVSLSGGVSNTQTPADNQPGVKPAAGNVAALQSTIRSFLASPVTQRGLWTKTPAYNSALARHGYYGGCEGRDCGAFVYTAIRESGWDPNFPKGPTWSMKSWLDSGANTRWEKIVARGETAKRFKDSAQFVAFLKPGDVFLQPGHVYIFTGKMVGSSSLTASASYCDNAPMPGWNEEIDPQCMRESCPNNGDIWRKVR